MNRSSRKERAAKKRPLHRQLLLSHLSVALVGIIILLAALISTYELRNRVVLLASEGAPLAQSSLRVLAGVQHSMASLRGWVSLGDPHFLQDWRHAWDEEIQPAVKTLNQCGRLYAQTCILERLQELQTLLTQLRTVQQRVQEAATSELFHTLESIDPLALQRMTVEADPIADRVIALTTALVADAETRFARDAAAARIASIATFSILITTALAMLSVAYLMSRNRAQSLARPIAALADATRRLEDGDSTHDLPIRRNDELGELTRAFNHMRVTIQQVQAELREANALLEKRVDERTTQLAMTNTSLMQEIEYRSQTEQALRESEARIRAMTRAIPDLVFVVDAEGRYREVLAAGREWETQRLTPIQGHFPSEAQHSANRQRLEFPGASAENPAVGIIPMPIRGKLLSEVHSPEMAGFFLEIIQRALHTRQIQVAEYELETTSGLRWFESRTAPLDAPLIDQRAPPVNRAQLNLFEAPAIRNVEKQAAIVVARDITKRKQGETQLRQAQKMQAIGQLTGGIAHDFNNLLAVIMGNLELLHEQLMVHPRLYELAQQALRAVDRGAALTRRLLIFARRQPLQAQPTDLNRLVLGMIELIRRTLGATIQIQTILAPDLEQTCIDPDQFESTLLNLVINARDAMPQSGRLVLETANAILDEDYAATHQEVRPGAYVVLAVSDSGSGMSPEVLERAFEPFFTTKETSKGSGLGLSMVYGLVKQSGGHVTIYSEPGRGTTVRLYLPRIHAEAASTPESPAAHPVAEGHGEMILVVEDDVDVCAFAVKALHSLGYQTCQAGDAKTALELLETTPEIALLFTDIVLPGAIDGVLLASEAAQRRPGLPILFTSGYTERMLVSGGELLADMELLAKPYRKAELAGKLGALLNRHPGP